MHLTWQRHTSIRAGDFASNAEDEKQDGDLHRRVELLELAQARLRSVRADVRLSNVVLRREVPQRCWLGVMSGNAVS